MRNITVEVDLDEKKGEIQFPQHVNWRNETWHVITEKKTRLRTDRIRVADYRLKSHPRAGGVERKGSPMELYNCLFGARRREFNLQLEKLSKTCQFPLLAITVPIATVLHYPYSNFVRGASPLTGNFILEHLAERVAAIGPRPVHIVWADDLSTPLKTRSFGSVVLSFLLGAAAAYDPNFILTPPLRGGSLLDHESKTSQSDGLQHPAPNPQTRPADGPPADQQLADQ